MEYFEISKSILLLLQVDDQHRTSNVRLYDMSEIRVCFERGMLLNILSPQMSLSLPFIFFNKTLMYTLLIVY